MRGAFWLMFFPAAVISAFLAIPGVPVGIVYVTCGLGIPLFLVPTGFVYLVGFFPGVLLRHGGVRRSYALVASALGVVLAALLPAGLSEAVSALDRELWTRSDRAGAVPQQPRELLIVRRLGGSRRAEPLELAPCEPHCQALLHGGEVDAVAVLALDGKGTRTAEVVYRREALDVCPVAFANADTATPGTVARQAVGDCLVPEIGATLPAAPWVSLTPADRDEVKRRASYWGPLHVLRGFVRFEVGVSSARLDAPDRLVTEVRSRVIRAPLLVNFEGNMQDMAPTWWRRDDTVNPLTWEDALRVHLGFAVEEVAVPDLSPAETLTRLLDRPGDAPFGPEAQPVIDGAFGPTFPRRPLSPDDLALAARVLRDPRVSDVGRLASRVANDAGALRVLLPDIVARLQLAVPESRGHGHSQLAWGLVKRLSIADLTPFGEVLLEAARADGEWTTSALLGIAGRLGVDPGPTLAAALANDSGSVSVMAVKGVCNADARWVTPELLDQVEVLARSSRSDDLRAAAVRALRRHGRPEKASLFLQGLGAEARREVLDEVEDDRTEDPPGGCEL